MSSNIYCGDALQVLDDLERNQIQCVITSPPYWGLRDYGHPHQIGLEKTLDLYLKSLEEVFMKIHAILREDGVLWLNLGDGYTSGNRKYRAQDRKNPSRSMSFRPDTPAGLKPKDLLGIPWRVAFSLQKLGWYLRSDIIWQKTNAMPESVKDRPYRNHEYLFLLTKSPKYFFNLDGLESRGPNLRSVWEINNKSKSTVHSATFPVDLVERCISTATKENDLVLDPFCGSGTVGVVSKRLGRRFIGIDIQETFVREAKQTLERLEVAPKGTENL